MANVSDWSANEKENTHLDELTLSGEGGLYTNKIMCAVKEKMNEVDGKLAKVQGVFVYRGTVADMTALEAVEDPENGDVYSVTALGGENWAWNGTAWDDLGTSDANVVHKTGAETVAGAKTFLSPITVENEDPQCLIKVEGITKGTFPTESNKVVEGFCVADENGEILFDIQTKVLTNGLVQTNIFSHKNISSSEDADGLSIYYSSTGTRYVTSPDLLPNVDNARNLGAANKLWKEIFAANDVINTSDEREKRDIAKFKDDVLDAWGDVDFFQFKFNSAVIEKKDNARLHFGVVAQRILSAFERHGLDATKYGLLCYDKWDADGGVEAGDRYGVRYSEALCIEAAYQRRKAERLEKRIAALEALLTNGK